MKAPFRILKFVRNMILDLFSSIKECVIHDFELCQSYQDSLIQDFEHGKLHHTALYRILNWVSYTMVDSIQNFKLS